MTRDAFSRIADAAPVVGTPPLRAALGDALGAFTQRKFWWIMVGAILVAVIAGPFDTSDRFDAARRLVYWSVAIPFSTVSLTLASLLAFRLDAASRLPWSVGAILIGAVLVLPIMAVLNATEWLLTGAGRGDRFWAGLPHVAVPVIVINLIVNGFKAAERQAARAPLAAGPFAAPGPSAAAPIDPDLPPPLLFDKLPEALGRDLVCLRAQDHYLEVTTTAGSAMVLMRLSDAERDLTALDGMRVHRSWWVALRHVQSFVRTEAGGLELTTTSGHTIPVARGQRAALRAAVEQRHSAAD